VKVPPDSVFAGREGDLQGGGDIPLGRVFPPLPTGVQWGLERTETLLRDLGNPETAYPTLHVGGTNGKGSLAAVWAQILMEDGRKVGLYTSPRLGGRLDSTNVIRPEITAITNVALDHAEYLGFTLEEIAGEKAGIIKPGVPVITAERDSALREIFRIRAEEVGAPFYAMNPAEEVKALTVTAEGNTFQLVTESWGTLDLRSPLPGRHQAANAALAIRSLELLPEEFIPRSESVRRGVEGLKWPGRLQIHEGPMGLWVFDVAHNTAGVRTLTTSLRRLALPEPIILLVGIQGDKDWRSMLPPLFAMAKEAVLTQPPSVPPERRWDPLEAAGAVKTRPNLHILPDFEEALEMARSLAGKGTVVVTGSHHTVGDGMNSLGILPYGPE
jgi:dihydrofolate synthase/folylpolyglutamate synthase